MTIRELFQHLKDCEVDDASEVFVAIGRDANGHFYSPIYQIALNTATGHVMLIPASATEHGLCPSNN